LLTKQDFKNEIDNSITNYPAIEARYKISDPVIMQGLDAIATMLSMLSMQLELSTGEVFNKTKKSTVLADAALRGIVNHSTPLRVSLLVNNTGANDVNIQLGRVLIDDNGYNYKVVTAATVLASKTAYIEAIQVFEDVITHTVTNATPFYSINVPVKKEVGSISGIVLSDTQYIYTYSDSYMNVFSGDHVFNIETDDKENIYIRLGSDGVIGVQPVNGELFKITVSYSFGNISLKNNSVFSFEYINNINEPLLKISLDKVVSNGVNPLSINEIKDLIKYPSIYSSNAVLLGDFEFLIRKNIFNIVFLSIWNEAQEEKVRGADVKNINTLFVACFSSNEQVLIEDKPYTVTPPTVIDNANLSTFQDNILSVINKADSSYKVVFYTPVQSLIYIDIKATVSASYSITDINNKISSIILDNYGLNSVNYRKKSSIPLNKDIFNLLKQGITELNEGIADISISIKDTLLVNRPELWIYVSSSSLSVSVVSSSVNVSSWGQA